jgi:hypothetical protein
MKTQAEGLSTQQIFALLGFIAPTGSAQPAPDWNGGVVTFHPTVPESVAARIHAGLKV